MWTTLLVSRSFDICRNVDMWCIVPPMSEIPILVSTRKAASILGVSVRTVHRLADSGDLVPAYRIDGLRGAMVFLESDVRERLNRKWGSAA